jgi:protein-S-isoprenylcysteine O-methyltransferase
MKLPRLTILGGAFVISELLLVFRKRSKSLEAKDDRHTLPLLWLVITASISVGIFLRGTLPQGRLSHPQIFYTIGLILMVFGLVVRWIAIIHLGRFFTVNVSIAKDHQLITTGPYRYVRHPSYSGTLLMFLGFGLCMLNIFSLTAVVLPILIAFLWRMHVEEEALKAAFGDRYQSYAESTYRLIPYLY